MTDTTAGRGGVGIRLYTTGGEVVKRTFDQVGDSGKKMWAEIATGNQRANPAVRALSAGVGEARNGVDALAGRAGPAGTVLANFGAAGVAAAAGLGGLAVAMVKAREAMEWSATLTDTSDRIGVSTTALQQWRYVADEAGVETSTLEANFEKLNGTLGAFKSGVGDARVKPVFESLGITEQQLASVQTADQMLLILADTLGQVQDRAVQVRFAKALGVEESLPIIRLGSDAIREMTRDAERLGLVVGEDVVESLDAADRQIELAQQRIDASMRLAVAGLAEDFADLISMIAGAVVQLVRFDQQLQKFGPGGAGGNRSPARGVPGMISDAVRGRTAAEGNAARDAAITEQTNNPFRRFGRWLGIGAERRDELTRQADNSAELRGNLMQLATGTGIYADRDPGYERVERPGRSGGRSGGADRSARDAERVLEQLAREMERADRDVVQAQDRLADTAERRADIALGMISTDLEEAVTKREALRAELSRLGILDQAAEEQLNELKILQENAAALRDRHILEEERKEIAERQLRRLEAQESDAIAMLGIEADLAETERERYQIARRILQHEQALERRRLEASLAEDPDLKNDPDERARRLKSFDAIGAGQVRVLDADENNRLREQFKSYGREVSDAIKAGRLGEYIGDRLKERLLDGALSALFDMVADARDQKAGGGGFWGTVLNLGASLLGARAPVGTINPGLTTPGFQGGGWFGGGLASGGSTKAGFHYRMAEHGTPELLMLGGHGQVANMAQVAAMVKSSGLETVGNADGGLTVSATYAPNISVQGSGPEIDALRRALDIERANFRTNVVETVNDAIERRMIGN